MPLRWWGCALLVGAGVAWGVSGRGERQGWKVEGLVQAGAGGAREPVVETRRVPIEIVETGKAPRRVELLIPLSGGEIRSNPR